MAIWTPDLTDKTGPKYQQIAEAITQAVAKGELRPGGRLPPHRILAYELGISPNTTSRAYTQCINAGLLCGETGRGTYVRIMPSQPDHGSPANLQRPAGGPIDLSSNLPFPGACADHLARTLTDLGRSPGLQVFTDYQTGAGLPHHIAAGRQWLVDLGVPALPEQTIITCGAQHGIMAALMAVTRPGDVLLTEALTYAPVMAMAARLCLKIRPIAMDRGGITPESFETACCSHSARAVYLTPTIQTPTTATMDQDRRNAVAHIAEKYDLILIEDDVYGPLLPEPVPPISRLAPERTIYISSTSKCLAPGLRAAFLHAPPALVPSLIRAVQLSCWMPPPLMVEVAARWIADGTADKLKAAQHQEAKARQAMAADILCTHAIQADPSGFHVWLSLPSQWQTHEFCRAASDRGVKLAPGTLFAVDGRHDPGAVRISLSHEPDRQRVMKGLSIIQDLLQAAGPEQSLIL